MKSAHTITDADALLAKYYEGTTTVEEERLLKTFLSKQDLPARFDADKAILTFFAAQSNPSATTRTVHSYQHPKRRMVLRWISMAALFVGFMFGFYGLFGPVPSNYGYVHGVKITDIELLNETALASIERFRDTPDEVLNSVDGFNTSTQLMEQQLSLFLE